MNKRKIAFVITKSNWGGAQKYVYDVATSLSQDAFDVVVIIGGEGQLKTELLTKNIRTISLPSLQRDVNIKKELASFKELFSVLREEKPDIVHLNSSKVGGLGALICRLLRIKKIIFTAHAWAFNENRNWFSKKAIAFIHWQTVLFSHHTIAVSEYIKQQVSHLPFIKNKITVIHLGIETPHYLSKNEAQQQLGISTFPGNIILGTIAELHPVKGLVYAIDALSLLKEKRSELHEKIHFYIIGEGDQRAWLESHISKRKLQDNITLLGYKKEAATYMKAFDAFILPSLSEAFGYVLLEAGLSHVPVLASKVGGIPEIIDEGVTGVLFPSHNAKAIRYALEDLFLDPETLQSYTEEHFNQISNNFSLPLMIEKTVDLYA